MAGLYRVYIRYGKENCVRFSIRGEVAMAREVQNLFTWIREPRNIKRLRKGLKFIYEVDEDELRPFLKTKLYGDQQFANSQLERFARGSLLVESFKEELAHFESLETGIEKLEFIANATEIRTIPRTAPRTRADGDGWLYLIDLEQKTLEIYGFQNTSTPGRLTVKRLFIASPNESLGFYFKLHLSELQDMTWEDFKNAHDSHTNDLNRIWKRNATLLLNTVPHADNLPYSVLYGGVFGNTSGDKKVMRLTESRLTKILAAMNRRPPTTVPFLKREPIRSRLRGFYMGQPPPGFNRRRRETASQSQKKRPGNRRRANTG